MRLLASLFALFLIAPVSLAEEGAPSPFDQNYAAMEIVDAALAEALAEEKKLLLVFGANWCHDSHGLAGHFQDPELAAMLADHYVTRFIDVGWRDQNQDVIRRFGVAALYATPMVLIIDPADETVLNRDQREDEVEDWRRELPRQVAQQRSIARTLVTDALMAIAGDAPVTADVVTLLDRQNPDLHLDFEPHQSERW